MRKTWIRFPCQVSPKVLKSCMNVQETERYIGSPILSADI